MTGELGRTPSGRVADGADASATLELAGPIDLVGTLRPLWRGPADPTIRLAARSVAGAAHTPDGAGAMVIDLDGSRASVRAWGPGATWLVAGAAGFLGLDDEPVGFEPGRHEVTARLARTRGAIRLGRTGLVFDALLPAILEQ